MALNFSVNETLPELGCTREDIYQILRALTPTNELVNSDVLQILSGKITAGDRLPFWRKVTKTHTDLAAASLTNDIELFQLPAGGVVHAVKVKHSAAFAGGALATYNLGVGVTGAVDKYVKSFDVHSAPSATAMRVAWAPLFDVNLPAAFVTVDGAVRAAVTQADGAIGGLTISAAYNQAEVTALRNACETLGDNVRALADACETLADDSRAMRNTISLMFQSRFGAESHDAAVSVRLSATSTVANLSAATAGSVDIWTLYSIET